MAVMQPQGFQNLFGQGVAGLYAAQQPQGPTNALDPKYASFGKPDERYAKAIEQQAALRDQIFYPQYQKSLNFALDKNAPGQAARQAAQQASRYNQLTRQQFMRMNERSQAFVDPAVQAETDRLRKFDDAKNIANAWSTAKNATRDLQAEQLGEVTGLGINTARQALGLSAGAASAYTDRQNRATQAEMMQQQANAAAQQANMQMIASTVATVASTAIAAAIA